MRITEQEQELRRERMLRVAYDLFCERGIAAVSIADIAWAAGVSSNSVFRYFANKATLLQQVQQIFFDEIVQCIIENSEQAVRQAQTGLDEMRVRLYGFQNLYQNYRGYVLFAYEYKSYLLQNKIKLSQEVGQNTLQSVSTLFLNTIARGRGDGSIASRQSDEALFLFIWFTMRHFVEQLVVYSEIYEGDNFWERYFPTYVEKLLVSIAGKFDDIKLPL